MGSLFPIRSSRSRTRRRDPILAGLRRLTLLSLLLLTLMPREAHALTLPSPTARVAPSRPAAILHLYHAVADDWHL
jgi:hypothetical protein